MLIHLARVHKQLEQKLADEGVSADVLTPIVLTPIKKVEMTEKRAESEVTSTTNDDTLDGDICAVCKTTPKENFFEHVLKQHGFSQGVYLKLKNSLEKEDKKPDLSSLDYAMAKVDYNYKSMVQVWI